ncbi:MAG: DUF1700 domain-containing protein [Blautia sp.]|nr:DUF1700 domain-containing protein [Lachnoclostridium sp.]MCM1211621.1 DUF1700 domain-containing protein [Blautia sp.]
MSRADFMRNLAELLADVPPAEREEAIQYYQNYFDDAGAENEQGVIASLGTPEQLARTIKAGLADGGNMGEFTEKGFSGYEQGSRNEVLYTGSGAENQDTQDSFQTEWGKDGYTGTNHYEEKSDNGKKESKPMSGGMIALIVILCVLAAPVLIGIGSGIFGGAVGVLGALFGILLGFGITAVVLILVGVGFFVGGVALMFGAPLGGLCMIGGALVCMAVGLFFLWLTVMIYGVLLPAIVKGIIKIFQSIFHKEGEKA